MTTVIDPQNLVNFTDGIRLGDNTSSDATNDFGTIRGDFHGLVKLTGADIFGNTWRNMVLPLASSSVLGGFRIGSNLIINPSTGVLDSTTHGSSRIFQRIITVSPVLGAADYTSIVAAILDALGPVNSYENGSITSILGAPSKSNQYIIKCAPGKYNEPSAIILPPYTSIIGDDVASCIITANNTHEICVMGEHSTVTNISFIITNNTYALFAYNLDYISIKNVNVWLAIEVPLIPPYANGIITQQIGICNIENINIDFSDASGVNLILKGIVSYTSSLNILDCTISLNGPNSTHSRTGIDADSSSIILENTNISITHTAYSYGVNVTDTNLYTTHCTLDIAGSDNSIGICASANNPTTSITSTSWNFITDSINGGLDVIRDTTNTIDTSMFTPYCKFKISVDAGANAGYYEAAGSRNQEIWITRSSRRLEASSGVGSTISKLYTISCDYTTIKTSDESTSSSVPHTINAIKILDTNGNYFIDLATTTLIGGPVSPNGSYVNYNIPRVIRVGAIGVEYNLLSDAVSNILDAASTAIYTIMVEPGTYTESTPLILKPWINIIAANGVKGSVVINVPTGGVSLASNIYLENVSFQHLATNPNARCATATNLVNVVLKGTSFIVNSTGIGASSILTALYSTNSTLETDSCNIQVNSITGDGASIAIFLESSNYTSNNDDIVALGLTLNENSAIKIAGSNIELYNTRVIAKSCTSINAAIHCVNPSILDTTVFGCIVQNSYLSASSSPQSDAILYANGLAAYYYTIVSDSQIIGNISYVDSMPLQYVRTLGCLGYNNYGDAIDSSLIIGDTAGRQGILGINDTIIGASAGSNISISSNVTLIGASVCPLNTTANTITAIGTNAAVDVITVNGGLISLGANSATGVSSAANSIYMGSYTTGTLDGDRVISIGSRTHNLANSSICIGESSTLSVASYDSIALGNNVSLYASNAIVITSNGSESIANNITIGNGVYLDTIAFNTYITSKGWNNSQFNDTFIGSSNISGNAITAIGQNISSLTSSGYSVILGSNTSVSSNVVALGTSITSGIENVMIGTNIAALHSDNTSRNVLIGTNIMDSGSSSTLIYDNVIIGCNAANQSSLANNSIIIGTASASGGSSIQNSVNLGTGAGSNSDQSECICIGMQAMMGNPGFPSPCFINTIIGANAGIGLTTGSYNTIIGSSAGYNISDGNTNVILGVNSSYGLISGNDNLVIGANCAVNSNFQTGNSNIIIGSEAAKHSPNISNNIIIGHLAGSFNFADGEIFIGANAGNTNLTGLNNIAIGNNAFASSHLGCNESVLIGYNAGNSISVDGCIAIGPNSIGSTNSSGGGAYTIAIGAENSIDPLGGFNHSYGYFAGHGITFGTNNFLMGYSAGAGLTSGSRNIMIGANAGLGTSSANGNIFIGSTDQASTGIGYQTTTGEANTFIGHQVGTQNTTGTQNLAIGNQAGADNSSGSYNTYLGYQAGAHTDTGTDNVFIGSQSGLYNSTGSKNIYIGYHAGFDVSVGPNNQRITAIGDRAGSKTSSNDAIFIGHQSGFSNITGSRIAYIGTYAGEFNQDGSDNLVIGAYGAQFGQHYTRNTLIGALIARGITGDDNVIIGSNAGANISTGSKNVAIGAGVLNSGNANGVVAIGYNAAALTQVDNIVAIGANAGLSNLTGTNNLYIGADSGVSNHSGNNNIFIGQNSGNNIITGDNNLFFGYGAGNTTSSNVSNFVAIGSNAGISGFSDSIYIGAESGAISSGHNNVLFGPYSGIQSISNSIVAIGLNSGAHSGGFGNIYIGSNSSSLSTSTGNGILCIGANSGASIANSVANCILIGTNSGATLHTGVGQNVYIGSYSGSESMSDTRNVVIGASAFQHSSGGANDIVVIGSNAGHTSSGNGCIFIGANCGVSNLGDYNSSIGTYSGYTLTGGHNVTVGDYSGFTLNGNNNVTLGYNAGYNSIGSNCVIIGIDAGLSNSGNNNIFIGANTGIQTVASDNLFIGSNAGRFNNTGSHNTCIGANSGSHLNDGIHNVLIGTNAGSDNYNGNYNTYLGANCGSSNNNGSQNVFIGVGIGSGASNATNNICIGSGSIGSTMLGASSNFMIGTNVGLQITSGSNNFLMGTNVASNATSNINQNTLVGLNAGQSLNGSRNTVLGNNSLISTSTETNDNIIIGNASGASMTGNSSVIIGSNSATYNTGSNVVIIGKAAGLSNTGNSNILVGNNTKVSANLGDRSIYIGSNCGAQASGSDNIAIGLWALNAMTSGGNCVALGSNAMAVAVGSSNVVAIGGNSGITAAVSSSILVGINSGQSVIGHDIIAIGANAMATASSNQTIVISNNGGKLLTGSNNVFVGSGTGVNSIAVSNSIVLGSNSASGLVTSTNSTILGHQASHNLANGANVVCIGEAAGYNATVGENVIVGTEAGFNILVGQNNTFLGYQSAYNTLGNSNIILGYQAGYSFLGSTNIIVGCSDFTATPNSSNSNVLIGQFPIGNGTGNNVVMGVSAYLSGYSVDSSGSNNVLLTTSEDLYLPPSSNCTNCTFIGIASGIATANLSNNILFGANSGALYNGNNCIIIGRSENIGGPLVNNSSKLVLYHDTNGEFRNNDNIINGDTYIALAEDYNTKLVGMGTKIPETYVSSPSVVLPNLHTKTMINGGFKAASLDNFNATHITSSSSIPSFSVVVASGTASIQNDTFIIPSTRVATSNSEVAVVGVSTNRIAGVMDDIYYMGHGFATMSVVNIAGNVALGDFICSTFFATGTYGMKQNSAQKNSFTLAKCIATVNWATATPYGPYLVYNDLPVMILC